jgi:integrase
MENQENERGAMRVNLKGVHRVRRTLSNGQSTVYLYAWRGGPRLSARPGSEQFLKEFEAAKASRHSSIDGTVSALIRDYKSSSAYLNLAEKSRKDYSFYLALIEDEFGTLPLRGIPAARPEFNRWREGFRATPRKADLAWAVLKRVLSLAVSNGALQTNPCSGGGRFAKTNRSTKIWTDDDLAKLGKYASPEIWLAVVMALQTGQRQGDLIRLPWSAYNGNDLTFRQSKTGKNVCLPATQSLKTALEAAKAKTYKVSSTQILVNSLGRPWTSDGFKSTWRTTCKNAGISGLTFHDLRGTAIVRLAEAGCEVPEISAISGHSLATAQTMLDTYWTPTKKQAEQAIRKLEMSQKRNKNVKRPVKRSLKTGQRSG